KEILGQTLIKEFERSHGRAASVGHLLWCLGRLGARVLLYGPANATVPRAVAERWLDALLPRVPTQGREANEMIFALSQLARVSGDRARDVDESVRGLVLTRLSELDADEATLRPVREYHELETAQQSEALGDALPVGLRLVGDAGS